MIRVREIAPWPPSHCLQPAPALHVSGVWNRHDNAATDFPPITRMLRVPNVLVMNADAATRPTISTLADLIAHAKAAPPDRLNHGSGGNPAQPALLSGQIDFNFAPRHRRTHHQERQAQGAGRPCRRVLVCAA